MGRTQRNPTLIIKLYSNQSELQLEEIKIRMEIGSTRGTLQIPFARRLPLKLETFELAQIGDTMG